MAYLITLTNGEVIGTIQNYEMDTTHTSITLPGQGVAGFGQALINGLVNHLENFSNSTAPSNPLQGQLWWNSTAQELNVYNSTSWVPAISTNSSMTVADFSTKPPGTFGYARDCLKPGDTTGSGTGSMVFVDNNSVVCAVWSGEAATT